MSLGAAILLAFVVLLLIIAGLIVLVIWLFRVGKRNEKAARVFHIMAAVPAAVILGVLVYIYFIQPKGLANDYNQDVHSVRAFAVSGPRVWLLARPSREEGFLFGYFNRNTRLYTWLQGYEEEGYNDFTASSIAWDGKQMAVTINADDHYLLVVRNDSVLLNETFEDDIFVSRDPQTGGYRLAAYDFPRTIFLHEYDRNFKLLGGDTFEIDEKTRTFSFSPQAIQYIGKNWYANGEDKTFKLEFSNDTIRFVPYGMGGTEGLDLFGSLALSGSYRWLLTEKGVQNTGLPEKQYHASYWEQDSYYRLYPDSMSWRFLLRNRAEGYAADNYLQEGNIGFHETSKERGHYYEYEVKYPGAEPIQLKVFDKYAGMTSFEMVFVSKDSLEVYYHDFSEYAIFNTLTGERIDNGTIRSSFHEWTHDDVIDWVSWFVLGFCILWLSGMIYCRAKKTNRFLGIPMHLYSLMLFFLFGIPYLVILIGIFLD